MKIVLKNTSLIFKTNKNLINQADVLTDKFLNTQGGISNALSYGHYVVSGKIDFTNNISLNAIYRMISEGTETHASYVVKRKTDNQLVRYGKLYSTDTMTYPQITYNSATDENTYVLICARIDPSKLAQWGAWYGDNIIGEYIGL